jgi:UDP-2-acetamido-2-deoxy-ribo-hexuluronate aminotransferase
MKTSPVIVLKSRSGYKENSLIPFIDLKAQYQALREPIQQRIQNVLEHGQFILGPEVEECERALAAFVGVRHAITCASGTDASIMAMMALGIGQGDEVITTAFSFIATAETIVLVGATPVLVDIDPITYNIDPAKIEEAITPKTKAIHPVGLYGQPADMASINAIAKKHNLFVIEDAAQSFGGTFAGRRSCSLADIGCTSFFPAKPLGCYGDGGALFTDNDSWAAALKEIRVHGQPSRYYHTRVGVNGRLDTLQCAILLPKLERFPWELEQRERLAVRYNKHLHGIKGLTTPAVASGCTSSWAQYTLRVEDRVAFQKFMTDKNVPTSVHYPRAMCDQPAYMENTRTLSATHSRRAADQVVSLPLYPDMPLQVQDQVIAAVQAYGEGASVDLSM